MSAVSIEFPAGGSANRAHYLMDLIEDAITRKNQIAAINEAAGAWSGEAGAEWAGMESSDFVSMLRNRTLPVCEPSRES